MAVKPQQGALQQVFRRITASTQAADTRFNARAAQASQLPGEFFTILEAKARQGHFAPVGINQMCGLQAMAFKRADQARSFSRRLASSAPLKTGAFEEARELPISARHST